MCVVWGCAISRRGCGCQSWLAQQDQNLELSGYFFFSVQKKNTDPGPVCAAAISWATQAWWPCACERTFARTHCCHCSLLFSLVLTPCWNPLFRLSVRRQVSIISSWMCMYREQHCIGSRCPTPCWMSHPCRHTLCCVAARPVALCVTPPVSGSTIRMKLKCDSHRW